jgi:hypothetical protein
MKHGLVGVLGLSIKPFVFLRGNRTAWDGERGAFHWPGQRHSTASSSLEGPRSTESLSSTSPLLLSTRCRTHSLPASHLARHRVVVTALDVDGPSIPNLDLDLHIHIATSILNLISYNDPRLDS